MNALKFASLCRTCDKSTLPAGEVRAVVIVGARR